MQDGQKSVWRIPYVSVAFFPSSKQNFISYRSSIVFSRPDCIFEIHQLWQSGFCRCIPIAAEVVHLNLKSKQLVSHLIRCILNCQESTTILNACTKKSGNLLNDPHILFWFYLLSSILSFNVLIGFNCPWTLRGNKCQSQVDSYQRLKKWYLILPCKALSIIR